MGKYKSKQPHKQKNSRYRRDDFFETVIKTYNDISDNDVENQKKAIKNAIKMINEAIADGKSANEIEAMLLYNMTNLFRRVHTPTLEDFYQARTYEYMNTIDITPYVEELLRQGINPLEYEKTNSYTANFESNIILALCVGFKYFLRLNHNINNPEFESLCQKIENNQLTMDDKKIIVKYVKQLLKETKIGKAAMWNKMRQNYNECVEMLYKYKGEIFDVQEVSVEELTQRALSQEHSQDADQEIDKQAAKKSVIMQSTGTSTPTLSEIQSKKTCFQKEASSYIGEMDEPLRIIKLKKFIVNPFISQDTKNNFLCVMNETFQDFDEHLMKSFYQMLLYLKYTGSTRDKNAFIQGEANKIFHQFFSQIRVGKDVTQVKEMLMERVGALTIFLKASGLLDAHCQKNNNILDRIYLGELAINSSNLFGKYIGDESYASKYFAYKGDRYERAYKGASMTSASDEAIAGLSAFYTNRMTKNVNYYTPLPFLFKKMDAIGRLCENPALNYSDLGFSTESIRIYMSVYRSLQQQIISRKILNSTPSSQTYKDCHDALVSGLSDCEGTYNTIYPGMGLNFDEDVDMIAVDAQLVSDLYRIKADSIKLLLYTALTDNKKNIINWGIVPEDDCEDEKFVLLGFDIKTLNSPLFVHIKRKELISFLEELTGKHELRIYEGANDIYSYSIRQRINTQVLYPLSKDEKKALSKVKGTGSLTDYYKHICWLQQNGTEPILSYKPGSRVYNLDSGEITIYKKKKTEQDPGDR